MPIQWPRKTLSVSGRYMLDSHLQLVDCDPNTAGGDITLVMPPTQIHGVEYFIRDVGSASASRKILIETVAAVNQSFIDFDGDAQTSLEISSPKGWLKLLSMPGNIWQVIGEKGTAVVGGCPCDLVDLSEMWMGTNQSSGTGCISPNWDDASSPHNDNWSVLDQWLSVTPDGLYAVTVQLYASGLTNASNVNVFVEDVAPTLPGGIDQVLLSKSFRGVTVNEAEPVDGAAITPALISGIVRIPTLGGKLKVRLCASSVPTLLGGSINYDDGAPNNTDCRAFWYSHRLE